MKAQGEFQACNLTYFEMPSRIAGLLKYKKHEWIVIVLISSKKAFYLWWNKGPNSAKVWSFLQDNFLLSTIRALKPDTIAILHSHPNHDPSRLRMNLPSSADLQSAAHYNNKFREQGISLLEFICERGVPHLYYAAFADSIVPIVSIAKEISRINGTHILKNYALRKELKRTTLADRVAGGATEARFSKREQAVLK